MSIPENHLEYVQRVGLPRVVVCNIRLGPRAGYVWYCEAHDYTFNDREYSLDGGPYRYVDRCPMSRLEEWRAKVWAAT